MLQAFRSERGFPLTSMESPRDVALRFRERAAELLVMAEKIGIPSAAADLRSLAAKWIEMAEHEERRGRRQN
jgi:hypothetical protein